MKRSLYWLTAAMLSVLMLTLSAANARAASHNPVLAGRYGAELGALASAGTGLSSSSPLPVAPADARAVAQPPAGAPAPENAQPPADSPTPPEPQPAADAAPVAAPPDVQPPQDNASPANAQPPADNLQAVAVPQEEPTEPPAPTPTPIPDKGKLIVIDAGHGGPEPGAVHVAANGAEDLIEKDINLSIAQALADMLIQDGYHVRLTRNSDAYVVPGASLVTELQARVDIANDSGADIFVSVHHNGSDNRSLHGTEVYYCSERSFSADSLRLATLVDQSIVRNLQAAGYDDVDRGVKDDVVRGHLALLAPYNLPRASKMPAIIGEALFMSNDADAAALQSADMRQAIARGYFEGIKAYFGDTTQ